MVETGRNAVTEIPALKWPEIKKVKFRYLGEFGGHKTDILTTLFVEDCRSVYADVDGKLGIRYDPETGHVAGVEIRGFEDYFLAQQSPELGGEWTTLKPEATDGIHSSGWVDGTRAIGLALCLQETVKEAAAGPDWAARQAKSLTEYREYMDFLLNRKMAEPPSLKWPEIRRVMYWYTGELYEGEVDALLVDSLMVLFVENRPAMNADADEDGDMMVRYDTDTSDVIGLEIELFEHHFLKKHPEFAMGWAALKPEGDGGFHNGPWLTGEAALGYARRLQDMAYQGTLAPGWPFEDLDSIAVKDGGAPSP